MKIIYSRPPKCVSVVSLEHPQIGKNFNFFDVVKCQNCLLLSKFAHTRNLLWVPSATQTFRIKLKVHILQNICYLHTHTGSGQTVLVACPGSVPAGMYTPTRMKEVNSQREKKGIRFFENVFKVENNDTRSVTSVHQTFFDVKTDSSTVLITRQLYDLVHS